MVLVQEFPVDIGYVSETAGGYQSFMTQSGSKLVQILDNPAMNDIDRSIGGRMVGLALVGALGRGLNKAFGKTPGPDTIKNKDEKREEK